MISPEHVKSMAAYNRWQNESAYRAAEALGERQRRLDRGAFFRSVHGTLSHILWADHIWLSRFAMCPAPGVQQRDSAAYARGWDELCRARAETDRLIEQWADGLSGERLAERLEWFSGSTGREAKAPVWIVVTHIFNHQTHHRGQVHAMLTAAGARTGDTDLFLMPAERWPVTGA